MPVPPTVLLVEDNPGDAQALRTALSTIAAPLALEVAASARDALDRLAGGPRPALLVIDLALPRVGGEELLRELRASPAFGDLPVVVWTGTIDPAVILGCRRLGIVDYVVKPDALPGYEAFARRLVAALPVG